MWPLCVLRVDEGYDTSCARCLNGQMSVALTDQLTFVALFAEDDVFLLSCFLARIPLHTHALQVLSGRKRIAD